MIIKGNAIEELNKMPPESVDLVVTGIEIDERFFEIAEKRLNLNLN